MEESGKFDYEKFGFKSGIEIHQQLDTHKLFCNCPSMLRKDEPDFEIRRRLHIVAGESGEIDLAVRHEAEKEKEFVYQGYTDNTCLVELDEEPPHEINEEALRTALHIAIFLNTTIIPISQIMRKTVIDGSNTSGFQRTIMIARDGYVETKYGRVGIEGIFLEEDSARLVSKEADRTIYRLDRLGIPLIEISTSPDIKTPEQAKEVALFIGNIVRSCKVKSGLGTIRQDVNMSIKNGARTELKGVQDPDIIVLAMNKEIERQLFLIAQGKKVKPEVRNVLPNGGSEFLRPMPGAARMYPETDLPLLKISKEMIDNAKRTLPKLREELQKELEKQGLSHENIKTLFRENKVEEYKELLKILNKPQLVAKVLLVFPKDIATRKKKSPEKIEEVITDHYADVLTLIKKKKISESDIKRIFEDIVDGKSLEDTLKVEKSEISDIEEKILDIIKSKPGLSENAYMGLVMKEYAGRINGEEAMSIIKKFVY